MLHQQCSTYLAVYRKEQPTRGCKKYTPPLDSVLPGFAMMIKIYVLHMQNHANRSNHSQFTQNHEQKTPNISHSQKAADFIKKCHSCETVIVASL